MWEKPPNAFQLIIINVKKVEDFSNIMWSDDQNFLLFRSLPPTSSLQ